VVQGPKSSLSLEIASMTKSDWFKTLMHVQNSYHCVMLMVYQILSPRARHHQRCHLHLNYEPTSSIHMAFVVLIWACTSMFRGLEFSYIACILFKTIACHIWSRVSVDVCWEIKETNFNLSTFNVLRGQEYEFVDLASLLFPRLCHYSRGSRNHQISMYGHNILLFWLNRV
jgi:hypothetical protein